MIFGCKSCSRPNPTTRNSLLIRSSPTNTITNIPKPYRPMKAKSIMNVKNKHWPILFQSTPIRSCTKTSTVMAPQTTFFTSRPLKPCTVKTELAKKYFWLICAISRTKGLLSNPTRRRSQWHNWRSFLSTTNTTSTVQ